MKAVWTTARLADVCHIVGGATPSKKNSKFYGGTIPWATVGDMNVEVITETEESITKAAVEDCSTNVVPAGSIVMATRVGLGKVCVLGQDTAINQDLKGLTPKNPKQLFSRWLFWWLKSKASDIQKAGTGATVQGVKMTYVQELEIPLPPLAEQKRIVALLDESFAGIDKAKANAESSLWHAKALIESHLDSIFTKQEGVWVERSLSELCVVDWGNTDLTKSAYIDDGEFLAVSAAGCDGRIGHKEHEKHTPVLSAIGAQCGRMFLPEEDFTAIKNTITLTPHVSKCTGKFLYRLLTYVELPKRGAAQPFIAKGDILSFRVAVPDNIEAQNRIERALSCIEADATRLSGCIERKLKAFSELKSSLLAQAFAGNLAP